MRITQRKPDWLKIKLEGGEQYTTVKHIVEDNGLHTICSSGKCPNIGQCWSMGTATFMILGDICTRSCKFCATKTGKPLPPEAKEAERVANSVSLMKLKHCVITSVDRDDLPDKGAKHWADTIKKIREINPKTIIEVLIPDFDADHKLLDVVIDAKPDIIGHNLETVKRLTPSVRSRASYSKSLDVLQYVASRNTIAKSGIMVGLGETQEEVLELMSDLASTGTQLFTIGQYLQPTINNIPVIEYVTPEIFKLYQEKGIEAGLKHVVSGPLVRSSYMAEKAFLEATNKNNNG